MARVMPATCSRRLHGPFSSLISASIIMPKASKRGRESKSSNRGRGSKSSKGKGSKAQQPTRSPTPEQQSDDDTPIVPSNDEPVTPPLAIVLPILRSAWKVNPKLTQKLHVVFDPVTPYVCFKRGERFSPEKDFPDRGDITPSELTDSQGDATCAEWMAYAPRTYRYVL